MSTRPPQSLIALLLVVSASLASAQNPVLEDKLKAAAQSFSARIESTTNELVAARQQIGEEKAQLAKQVREAQDRLLALRADVDALEAKKADVATREVQSAQEVGLLKQNLHHIETSVAESLSTLQSQLGSGESETERQAVARLLEELGNSGLGSKRISVKGALDLLEKRLYKIVGGHWETGSSLAGGENRLVTGSYAFFGPAVYFRSDDGGLVGIATKRPGSNYAATHAVKNWSPARAAELLAGEKSDLPVDASGGKALQLEQERGGIWSHVQKGGMVAYVIIALGLFALATALLKLLDLKHMAVDSPARVEEALQHIAQNEPKRFEQNLATLKSATQDLMRVGLRHLNKPQAALEEHLYANILLHRLRQEKLLPMLRVIAAAAPLLGLLGTIVGMVKTFTLITVFGTGNAEKLSSGISEALVTTELGLIVAIPTLVVYGFLSQRSHRSLSLLEQYSVEFVAASEESKALEKGHAKQ